MAELRIKLARIGNSKGIRLPADLIRRYGLGHGIRAELTGEGILLRPLKGIGRKLGWGDAGSAMAAEKENWSDWEATGSDGLDQI